MVVEEEDEAGAGVRDGEGEFVGVTVDDVEGVLEVVEVLVGVTVRVTVGVPEGSTTPALVCTAAIMESALL